MRNIFAETIFKESQKNNKIFILVADISPAGKMLKFQKQFPNRFLNVGVSEQTMIGMCAGLSTGLHLDWNSLRARIMEIGGGGLN
jgi:transketolase